MKALLILLMLLMVSPVAGQKKSKAAVKRTLPYTLPQNELSNYVYEYDTKKGDFEKTEEYQQRLSKYYENKPFICIATNTSDEYAADGEIMTFSTSLAHLNDFKKTKFAKDSNIIGIGLHKVVVEYKKSYLTSYAIKVTNVEDIASLGLTISYEKEPYLSSNDSTLSIHCFLPVKPSVAQQKSVFYKFVLCLKMGGQDKTAHVVNTTDFDNGDGEKITFFTCVAEAAITGFKIVDTQTNKVILEKHLP